MDTVIFNVRCPHCDKPLQAEVTGFCRTGLNSRWKECKFCRRGYTVVFLAETAKGPEFSDLHMSYLRDRLKALKITRLKEKLLLERSILDGERKDARGIIQSS